MSEGKHLGRKDDNTVREDKFVKEGLTFDDVLLVPDRADIHPHGYGSGVSHSNGP